MLSDSICSSARPKISARARVQTDKITGKPVLLYPEGALMLNPTAYATVSLCSGQQTFDEIVANLVARYQRPMEEITAQVTEFLNRLKAKNLLEL